MFPADGNVGAATFSGTWASIKLVLAAPDQRSLAHGLPRTTHSRLDALFGALEHELRFTSSGPCWAYVRKNQVLPTLATAAANDTPAGVRAAVLSGLARVVRSANVRLLSDSSVARPIKHVLLMLVPDAGTTGAQQEPEGSDTASLESGFSEKDAATWVVRDDPADEGVTIYPGTGTEVTEPPTASGSSSHPAVESVVEFVSALVERTYAHPSQLLSTYSSHAGKVNRYLPWDVLVPLVSLPLPLGQKVRTSLLRCIELAMHRLPTAEDEQAEPNLTLQTLSLAQQVTQSDLASMLGAALGAAYGWLPRALTLALAPNHSDTDETDLAALGGIPVGMHVGPEPTSVSTTRFGGRTSPLPHASSDDVQEPLNNLLGLLDLSSAMLVALLEPPWVEEGLSTEDSHTVCTQRCKYGTNMSWQLTHSVRTLFVNQILYPAILECSDSDGTATAVLLYLTAILQRVPDASPLAPVILGVLAADTEEDVPPSGQETKRVRYTLKDLLLAHLRSSTAKDTHVQALQLVQVLFHSHGRFAVRLLMQPQYRPDATNFPVFPGSSRKESVPPADVPSTPTPTHRPSAPTSSTSRPSPDGVPDPIQYEKHERHWLEIRMLAALVDSLSVRSLASGTSDVPGLRTGLAALTNVTGTKGDQPFSFDAAHSEALSLLASDSLFQWGMYATCHPSPPWTVATLGHSINPHDRLWRLVTLSVAHWFANDPQVNLALSGVLASLAACPVRNLEGWLTYPPAGRGNTQLPVLLTLLRGLSKSVATLREQVGGEMMDALLVERTTGFVFVDQLQDALADPPPEDEVRPLGGGQAARKQPTSYGTAELVSNSQIRSAWAALSSDRSEGTDGIELVERSARTLHPSTPEPDDSERERRSGLSHTKHVHHRQGIARLFAGRGEDRGSAQRPALPASSVADQPMGKPFAHHYVRTQVVHVRVHPIGLPPEWTRQEKTLRFAPDPAPHRPRGSPSGHARDPKAKPDQEDPEGILMSLSSVLDNVVVLRETVRELAAVLEARWNVGIDA